MTRGLPPGRLKLWRAAPGVAPPGDFIDGRRTTVGTHVGSLWTASGTLLGTVTFGPETASGWQQATFATPIAITAGTTYVASYFAPFGNYAEENWYFDAPLDTVPLHAVTDGPGGSVYKYGGTTAFPNQAYKSSNYFVDVVFVETIGGQP